MDISSLEITSSHFVYILLLFVLVFILFLLIRKIRKRAYKGLKKDACGLWKYHQDSQFIRKTAYVNKQSKSEKKSGSEADKKPIAVISFDGDIRAKSYPQFSKLVDEIIINKDQLRSVVVVITSPGGVVPTYGQVFSQMERIRDSGLEVIACIDVVAASGGYLMALPANKIVASPFSFVGSIGVMAFVPNFRGLLEKFSINPRTFTSGKFKRTVTFTDSATEEEVQRFQNELDSIHNMFLDAVRQYRPKAKMDEVETGAHWTAKESIEKELGLVDELGNSSQLTLDLNKENDLIFLAHKKSFLSDSVPFVIDIFLEKASFVASRVFASRVK